MARAGTTAAVMRNADPEGARRMERTDPATERMCQETGHDCIACPTAVRDLMATAHNLLGALDAARRGNDWARAWRKAEALRGSLAVIQSVADEHFAALQAWRRP